MVNEGRNRDEIVLTPVESEASEETPYGELRLGVEEERFRGLITPGNKYELEIRPT